MAPAQNGDALAVQLHARIAEYRQCLEGTETPSADDLAAADEACNKATAAYWFQYLQRSSEMQVSDLRDAIHIRGLNPIDAALTDAFRERRRGTHELALVVARLKRAMGTISQEAAEWLDLMEWEPETGEWPGFPECLDDPEWWAWEPQPAPAGVFDPNLALQFMQALGKNGTTRARAFFHKHDPRKKGDKALQGIIDRRRTGQCCPDPAMAERRAWCLHRYQRRS